MKRYSFGLILLALSFIISCSDEDGPNLADLFKIPSSGCKLKKIINTLDTEGQFYTKTYEYDSKGRLISEHSQVTGETGSTTIFIYNSKDQLIKREHYSDEETQSRGHNIITWKNGAPVSIEFYEGTLVDTWELKFSTKGLTSISFGMESEITEGLFTYQNNNLHRRIYDGELVYEYADYDSKHNPYRSIAYAMFETAERFSENNFLRLTSNNVSLIKSYSYNEYGYPIHGVSTWSNGNDGGESEYEYIDCD